MRRFVFTLISIFGFIIVAFGQNPEKTCFQTGRGWIPELDLRSDVAIVYGVNKSFPDRVQGWRDRGYGVHLMTGVAWGNYQEYLNGQFDGQKHMDEGQVQRNGKMILHNPTIPYMVPSKSYIEYLKSLVKVAIDEGVTAIHLEEPEFWNRGGYSDGFKREWQAYYNEPWQAQHESPEATYRSAKLKYHLYFRALQEIFLYAKNYSEEKGRRIKCYVPTHSLINYSAWNIVSPESSLADLPGMDGYIAQVWTGTSRTPVFYEGIEKERTFENAYLEYGSMVAMTKPTGRRVFFLTDPIEDNPDHSWEDYKYNYEATFTAQLLHPSVANYEVMPWPSRIFTGKYKKGNSDERQGIPGKYATELLVLINALNEMQESDQKLPGTQGIGVLLSDTMMFQRFPTHAGYEDPRLSNFYGMVLPLLKKGVPVQLVQMENLPQPDLLDGVKILIMSYANMKPLNKEYHEILAQWVHDGGCLIFAGSDADPFQSIREWWNENGKKKKTPAQHLLDALKFDPTNSRVEYVDYGKGKSVWIPQDPKEFVMKQGGSKVLLDFVKQGGIDIQEKNYFHLQRGAFDIAAVLDEGVSDQPYVISGPVIDLFDPDLPVLDEKRIEPNQRVFLYNLNRNSKKSPCILASGSRVYKEKRNVHSYTFVMKAPIATNGIARILLASEPDSVSIRGADGKDIKIQPEWDQKSKTLLIRYPNHPDGIQVDISW